MRLATCEVAYTVFSYSFYLFKHVILLICVTNSNIKFYCLCHNVAWQRKTQQCLFTQYKIILVFITPVWKRLKIKKFRWRNIFTVLSYTFWGKYHQELSSQLITLKSRIFLVKNSNLQSSGLVGLVAKSSVFKSRQFWNLLSSHLRFWWSFNLLSSQGLIFRLPKNPVTPLQLWKKNVHVSFHQNCQ